jgi:hypothetical protein
LAYLYSPFPWLPSSMQSQEFFQSAKNMKYCTGI